MMRPSNKWSVPAHAGTIDSATLYLCRQGPRWVIVIESPRISSAVPFHQNGLDSHDARSELLTRVREACPDAAIMSTDGALTSEDYEWRVEVRGIEARPGDLGVGLHRALSAEAIGADTAPRQTIGRRCHWGLSSSASGRPRTF